MSRIKAIIGVLFLVSAEWVNAAHEIPFNSQQMERLGISVVQVELAASVVTDRLPARVVIPPRHERVVSTPLGGLVTELRAGLGDEVDAGDALAVIESPAIIGLQREFLQATTEEELAALQLKRDRQLFKEGIIAERRYLEARSTHERATATLEEQRQVLVLSGMDATAIDTLANTRKLSSALTVRATSPGVVLESFAVVGQRVERAEALFRLAQLEPLWLEIRVPLRRLEGIQPNAGVELPCPHVKAEVNLIGRDVDPASQTVLVRAEAHGAGECLRPGQYVQARLRLGGEGHLYRVPTNAVVHAGNRILVFARAPFGFLATKIEVISDDGQYAVVRGELNENASVAVSGIAAIKGAWMGLGGGAE